MKNLLYLIIAFTICIFHPSNILSQKLIGITPDKDVITDGKDDCVTTRFTIPVPYLRSDCPDSMHPDINISYSFKDCFGYFLGVFCDFSHSDIEVNGTLIKTINYGEMSSYYNETITSDEYAHLLTNVDEVCFTIRVFKVCTLLGISEVYSATKCVSVHKEGDQFTRIRYDGPVRQETLECQQDEAITVCCNDAAVTISSEMAFEVTSAQSNELEITFGNITVGGEALEIDFPTTYSSSTSFTSMWTDGTRITRTLTIEPEPGVCKSAALNINFLKEYTDYFSVGDCDEEILPYMSQVTGEAVFNITFHECNIFTCPQERPNVVLSGRIEELSIRDVCVGAIQATLPSQYEGELQFSWTGPYGFTSESQNLELVPFGHYILVVTDDCCNEYEYSYFLCNDIQYGAWTKDEMNLFFCRSLHCNRESCEVPDSEECVEPDEVIEAFENGSCTEKYYFQGEYLGSVSSIGDIKLEYNEATNLCRKIAKCKSEEFIVDEAGPTYGFWDFDYAVEECQRLIFCFNEEMTGLLDSKEPEIEETYNLITGLCNRTAFCSIGEPIILSPKPPIVSNPWQWAEFQGCTKLIQCSTESGYETVAGAEDFINWTFNPTGNICESEVTCENTWVPGMTHSEFPTSIGTWNWSSDRPLQEQCYRTIICGGSNYIEDTTQPTYQTTGVPCGEGLFQYYIICGGVNTFETGCGSFKSDTKIHDTRNLNQIPEREEIQIYPNPFTDIIYVDGLKLTNEYHAVIHNAKGQLVHQQKINNESIDLSHLTTGIYTLSIKYNKEPITIQTIFKN